jgi:hypothetical protein
MQFNHAEVVSSNLMSYRQKQFKHYHDFIGTPVSFHQIKKYHSVQRHHFSDPLVSSPLVSRHVHSQTNLIMLISFEFGTLVSTFKKILTNLSASRCSEGPLYFRTGGILDKYS